MKTLCGKCVSHSFKKGLVYWKSEKQDYKFMAYGFLFSIHEICISDTKNSPPPHFDQFKLKIEKNVRFHSFAQEVHIYMINKLMFFEFFTLIHKFIVVISIECGFHLLCSCIGNDSPSISLYLKFKLLSLICFFLFFTD